MDPVRTRDCLTVARRDVFAWIRPLGSERRTREFPSGPRPLRATLADMARAEWRCAPRLSSEPVPPRDHRPIGEARQPAFADLCSFPMHRRREEPA